jgi:hypothetical protein
VALAVLAGGPAILGTLLGSYAFDPVLATVFLAIGIGAILQVIWEVGKMVVRDNARRAAGRQLDHVERRGGRCGDHVLYGVPGQVLNSIDYCIIERRCYTVIRPLISRLRGWSTTSPPSQMTRGE